MTRRGIAEDDDVIALDVDSGDRMRPCGSWQVGDDAVVIVEDSRWYPKRADGAPGLVALRRVLSQTWTYGAGGEQLRIGLGSVLRRTPPPTEPRRLEGRVRAVEGK